MIHKIYSVYDSKSQTYTLPFFQGTKAQAIRTFTNMSKNPEHQFCMNPEDFTLFEVGEYDDILGTITQDKIVSVGLALNFISE